MKTNIDLSVVIVNYNVRYFLEQCILSILAASKNISVEIIVIDNNSSDDSCKMLQEKYPNVILIQNACNKGFSKANNQGVFISKGEYVLILNPDTVIAEDTLFQILSFAKTKQNLGILGVKLIDGAGQFLPESKRGIPTPMVSFIKLFGLSGKNTGKYYATHLGENESGVVDVLVGAFMLLKKSVYLEVNGFDEDYFMYGEDIDLSYKVLKKGYQNYYFSDAKVIHYKGESTKKGLKYLRYFHKAMKIFYRKHFKLNWFYDVVMNLGIECWFLLKFFKFFKVVENKKPIQNVLYVGSNKSVITFLNRSFNLTIVDYFNSVDSIRNILKKSEIDTVVFENEEIPNKEIINYLETLKSDNFLFKIHPKNTNFLIGSTCSVKRGFVELIS